MYGNSTQIYNFNNKFQGNEWLASFFLVSFFLTLRRLFSPSCAKSLDTFIVYKFISNARRLTFDEATEKRREAGTPPSSDTLYCHLPPRFLPSSSSFAPFSFQRASLCSFHSPPFASSSSTPPPFARSKIYRIVGISFSWSRVLREIYQPLAATAKDSSNFALRSRMRNETLPLMDFKNHLKHE